VDQTNTDVEEDIDKLYDIFSPDFLLLLNVNVFLNISVSLIHWDIDRFYDIFSPEQEQDVRAKDVIKLVNISVDQTNTDVEEDIDI
jgi:hypothetical protein